MRLLEVAKVRSARAARTAAAAVERAQLRGLDLDRWRGRVVWKAELTTAGRRLRPQDQRPHGQGDQQEDLRLTPIPRRLIRGPLAAARPRRMLDGYPSTTTSRSAAHLRAEPHTGRPSACSQRQTADPAPENARRPAFRGRECRPKPLEREAAPIVVAVGDSAIAAATARDAVRLARELTALLVFVYVRRGPSAALGEPYYQRRLAAEMRARGRALNHALAVARRAGVPATGEQLAGHPARRVVELARLGGARLAVLGSRRRRLGRNLSRDVIRSADRPVLVAGGTAPVA